MKRTNWTQATTNPMHAIIGVLSAQQSNRNAWIELQENGKQDYPIKIKNPELDNPFNWKMAYDVPKKQENYKPWNDTDADLVENWTAAFGDEKAIKQYQKNGKLSKNLIKGIGISHPIKKSDFRKLRPDLSDDFNLWYTYWEPIHGIPYWITDPSIKKVYVVCTDDEPINSDFILERLKEFVNSLTKL
jgi:hypothetical protein